MIRKSKRNSGQLPPSFVPNSQIMPLENEMKKPKVFMKTFGVLNIGMGVIVALYTGMGFFGYIRYGGAIEGSITFSLGEPLALANAVQILLAIAIFFTHPIQCYVAIDIIWNEYIAPNLEKNSHKLLWEYVVRTSLVLLTCKWTSVWEESFTRSDVNSSQESNQWPHIDHTASIILVLLKYRARFLFLRDTWTRFPLWMRSHLTSRLNYPFRDAE